MSLKTCPFCHLFHDYEKSNCDGHDGTRSIRIRNRGPMTHEERKSLGLSPTDPAANKWSIIDLLNHVGIANVQVQQLATAQDSISTNERGESTIQFVTRAVTADEQFRNDPERKIGLILWMPANLLPGTPLQ